MQRFKALLASKTETGSNIAWTELGRDDLMEGDVLVRVTHSTINYKDGLALTGKAPIIRKWPLIPGIDFAGEVLFQSDAISIGSSRSQPVIAGTSCPSRC